MKVLLQFHKRYSSLRVLMPLYVDALLNITTALPSTTGIHTVLDECSLFVLVKLNTIGKSICL